MISLSFISLFAAVLSIMAISLALNIFNKVYQEDYKKPWLFIGVSTIFLGTSQLLRFLLGAFNFQIVNYPITEAISYVLDFISVSILTYALLLEYLILIYIRGKFVKMKFIPIQEGSMGGELDINVSNGNSYLAFKKDKKFLLGELSKATRIGFEGFLLTEDNPKEIREKYKIPKTPIAWISQIDSNNQSSYLKDSLDENSDIVDPIQLNNMINFIDNFLDQSQNPFVMIDLNMILRTNNYSVVLEFLKYISSRTHRFNGILMLLINIDILKKEQISELKTFITELE